MIGSRLGNPKNVEIDSKKFLELQAKISTAMTRMYKKPENGGNPFLFGFAAAKDHELRRTFGTFEREFTTAATDGHKFFWNPEFLDGLTTDGVMYVMEHEVLHLVLFHCQRGKGKNPIVWNIAIDYVCNAAIMHDFGMQRPDGKKRKGDPFTESELGKPIKIDDFIKVLDKQKKIVIELNDLIAHPPVDQAKATKLLEQLFKKKKKKGAAESKGNPFGDISLYGKSPEEIYNRLMDHWPPQLNLPSQKCDGEGDGASGSGDTQDGGDGMDTMGMTDEHVPATVSKQEVQAQVVQAADFASKLRGTVSDEVKSFLEELSAPRVSFTDLVRNAMYRKVIDAGKNNDWKHLRRRYINMGLYLPRRYMHRPHFLAMLDTSGSMNESDMAYGVSQLLALKGCSGVVVPVDAAPHWESASEIVKVDAVSLSRKVNVVGRGGTTFAEFFRDYPKKLGIGFDVVIVMTDSYIDNIPVELKPRNCEVVWVLTTNNTEFKPPFGRVAHLRNDHM